MTVRPATVLIGWVLANLALAGLLVSFRESAFGFVLYFASALPITAFGVLLWRLGNDHDRNPTTDAERLILPGSSGPVVIVAVGLTLIGLGLVFGEWLWIIGALVTAAAVIVLVRSRGISRELPERIEDVAVLHPAPSRPLLTAERVAAILEQPFDRPLASAVPPNSAARVLAAVGVAALIINRMLGRAGRRSGIRGHAADRPRRGNRGSPS